MVSSKVGGVCLGLIIISCSASLALAARLATITRPIKPHGGGDVKILVELFKMSRCPDAQRVEMYFDSLLERVKDIAEVEFHYIGTVPDPAAGVVCKHGEQECDGDKQQLCVQRHAGTGDLNYNSLWQFVRCQDNLPDEIGALTLAEDCLKQTVPDRLVEKVRQCFTSREGDYLLRGDVERVMHQGITRSCTIFIDHKKRCVHDGNTWYDCDGGHEEQDFVDTICDAYLAKTGQWPALCGDTQPSHAATE